MKWHKQDVGSTGILTGGIVEVLVIVGGYILVPGVFTKHLGRH